MKLSKVFWVILIIGITAIGGYLLFQLYTEATDEKEVLGQSLSTAQSALPSLATTQEGIQQEITDLEAALSAAYSELGEAEAKFLETVSGITYGDILFFQAQVLDLEITSFSSSSLYSTSINDLSYEAIDITINLNGSMPSILSYLSIIELASDFKTTNLETTSISITTTSDTAATINIQILAYKGG
jgi:hypothetical protein